jgi:hypothetical protein
LKRWISIHTKLVQKNGIVHGSSALSYGVVSRRLSDFATTSPILKSIVLQGESDICGEGLQAVEYLPNDWLSAAKAPLYSP